jgi:NAD(P)-dependent dehydrogenase (short-subunit alcohol dehydrogenase family)
LPEFECCGDGASPTLRGCATNQQEKTMPFALMTGGGSAIGEGIARCLIARGWSVAVTDINLDLAKQVAAAAGARAQAL